MSASEVDRLVVELKMIGTALDELKKDFKEQCGKISAMEMKLELLNSEHCAIQAAKRDKRIKWEVVYPSVISTVSAALVIYLIIGR
jgi:hypothetical protein